METEKKSFFKARSIISLSLLIMTSFAVNVFDQVKEGYRDAWESARRNDEGLINIMAQQLDMAFLGVENTLTRVVQTQYFNEKTAQGDEGYTLKTMQSLVNESQLISAMLLLDEKGEPVMGVHKKGYEHWSGYQNDFSSGNFFARLKEGQSEHLIDLLPARKDEEKTVLILGQRLQHADGSFAGVYLAAVNPQFFIDFFKALEQGKNSYISIQMAQSNMLAADIKPLHSTYSALNAEVLAEAKTNPSKGNARLGSYHVGNLVQVYGYLYLKTFPIVVNVVLDENDYLRNWQETRLKDYGFLCVFIAFGSLLSFLILTMARQILRVEKSEAAAVLASQAKSEFLANMSHELRTPLNAIIGFSEMMSSGYFGQLNPKQKERTHDINLCGSHLLNLITDILEFSKGDAGKLELLEEPVAMADIVNESSRIMTEKIKYKRINLITELDERIPTILADKRKLRQILLNLLSNAVKFTPENGTVKVVVCQDAGQNVTMTVSDTGIGIAEKDIPVALSVFGQVHRNQSHEGTGLGLPLCKMFAELHGGRLAFGSKLGEGTTVRITFPMSRNMDNALKEG